MEKKIFKINISLDKFMNLVKFENLGDMVSGLGEDLSLIYINLKGFVTQKINNLLKIKIRIKKQEARLLAQKI
jgi:hypothetical protein